MRHRRAVALLALLALRDGRPAERRLLAETIWPEREPEEASVNLRRALADLREILGTEAHRVAAPDRRTLRLSASCDVLEFDDAARRFRRDACAKEARKALDAYRGPFLEGWTDDWAEPERQHRVEVAATLAEALAKEALVGGETSEALRLLDRADSISPNRESTLRLRLDVHFAQGDGTAARSAYVDYARRLDRELGLKPGAETLRLAEGLRPASPPDAGPRFVWPLVGREAELARLRLELEEGGVVTLVGPGGVGKTRLAMEAIEGTGAGFVDLARLASDASVREVVQAVDTAGDPLVLDNAEHLLPTIALAAEDAAGRKKALLVTSRSPLGVPGERLVRLAPLGPAAAIRVFASRAEAARPGASLDAERVERVCRRLEGMPLAMELAAARLRTLPLADLEARLDAGGGLDLLASAAPSAPDRQRTMVKTVLWSLSLLSDAARRALVRLCVFRAGFTLEAAETVVGSSALDVLSELVDQSLVLSGDEEPPRYRILEIVRTVAGEGADPADAERSLGRWAAAFVADADQGLWRGEAAGWTARIESEWANLRAAVERGDAADSSRVVEAVDPLWWRTGRFREGIAWREAARRKAVAAGDSDGAIRHVLAAEQFRRRLGEPNRARSAFRESVDAHLAAGRPSTAMYLLYSLGFIERDDGDLARAGETMREALGHAETTGEPGLVAYATRGVALADLAMERWGESIEGHQSAAAIFSREGFPVQETFTLASLAEALLESGDFEGAASVAELTGRKARLQRSPTVEMAADWTAARAALALGDPEGASWLLDGSRSLADAHDLPELRADVEATRSALARARGLPDVRIVSDVLRGPSAAHLPYPTLLRVLEEATRTMRDLGSIGAARRLEDETLAAREAAKAGSWSAGLTVTRSLAAFPARSIRDD